MFPDYNIVIYQGFGIEVPSLGSVLTEFNI